MKGLTNYIRDLQASLKEGRKLVKITKIKELEDALHPHNIDEGETYIGVYNADPVLRTSFVINAVSFQPKERGFYTSMVTEIIDANTFKTLNSIYKWEIIEEDHEILRDKPE